MSVDMKKLRKELIARAMQVEFWKKDRSLRVMRCTLNVSLIPEDKLPKDPAPYDEDATNMHVFDLDKNEWRSFIKDNVLSARPI